MNKAKRPSNTVCEQVCVSVRVSVCVYVCVCASVSVSVSFPASLPLSYSPSLPRSFSLCTKEKRLDDLPAPEVEACLLASSDAFLPVLSLPFPFPPPLPPAVVLIPEKARQKNTSKRQVFMVRERGWIKGERAVQTKTHAGVGRRMCMCVGVCV